MKPLQRRTLWVCVFVMTFNFFYEASGNRLITLSEDENAKTVILQGQSMQDHFWGNIGFGCFFLVMGIVLTFVLTKKEEFKTYTFSDALGITVGCSAVLGTAIRSYLYIQNLGGG